MIKILRLLAFVGVLIRLIEFHPAPEPPRHGVGRQSSVRPLQESTERICVALDYILSHYRKMIGGSRFFLVKVESDASLSSKLATSLSARHPTLTFSSFKRKIPHSPLIEIGVTALNIKNARSVVTKVHVQWGPREGFGMSLLLSRKQGKWSVEKVFDGYQI